MTQSKIGYDIISYVGTVPLIGPSASPEEEIIRQTNISKKICPTCGGSLLRGKKLKSIDYRRIWNCINCGTRHYK